MKLAVDPIEFGFVEGIDSACGIAGDAQQSVAFPAPGPRWGVDARHGVFWPLSGAGARAPKRLGVAASAGLSPSGPGSEARAEACCAIGFRVRCWPEPAPPP